MQKRKEFFYKNLNTLNTKKVNTTIVLGDFKKLVDNWKTENEIKRMPRNAEICQISK